MPHPTHAYPSPLYGDWQCLPQCNTSSAAKEQDLLMVAAEVQRMVEIGGFRPIPLEDVSNKLSQSSYMILTQHKTSLFEALEANPKSVRVTEHDGKRIVSWYGVTWLGPGCPPPQRVPEPAPMACSLSSQPASQTCGSTSVMRGKALENMSQLAGTPELQETLRDIATCLLSVPNRILLVSELGCKIAPGSRTFLRTWKLRAAQLLQCFNEDFELQGTGPGTAVKYLHDTVLQRFKPQPRERGVQSQRHCRLLKLTTDVSECYGGRIITARQVLDDPSPYLLVDCRTLAERTVSVLPNSVAAVDLTDMDFMGGKIIVAYCAIGCRSAKWCQSLVMSEGVTAGGAWSRFCYMGGGIAAWAFCGGQFVDPQRGTTTQRVHCWVKELESYFPTPRSGYEIVATALPADGHWLTPLPEEALSRASGMRFSRLRSLAWEVRLRYWPSVFCVEAQDVLSSMRSGDFSSYILVDCRTPEEREVSMIDGEGLTVMSAEEFNGKASEILSNPNTTVVTYCTVGGRSGIWSKRFIERFSQEGRWKGPPEALSRRVLNLLGGIAGWLHGEGKLSLHGRRTTYLHPWCSAFLDLFPLSADVQIKFDESMPDPADALHFAACKPTSDAPDKNVPQKLIQLCTTLPREVLGDSLARAMRSVLSYED